MPQGEYEPGPESTAVERVGRLRRNLGKAWSKIQLYFNPTPEERNRREHAWTQKVFSRAWKDGWRPSGYIDYVTVQPLDRVEGEVYIAPATQNWENYPREPLPTAPNQR